MNNRLQDTGWAGTPEEGFAYVSFYSVSKKRKVFILFQSDADAESFMKKLRAGGKSALEYRDHLKGRSAFTSPHRWAVYHMDFAPGADFFGRLYRLANHGSKPFTLNPKEAS